MSTRFEYTVLADAFAAGRYSLMRDSWMHAARQGSLDLRQYHVALARNAHHSYLRASRRALRLVDRRPKLRVVK